MSLFEKEYHHNMLCIAQGRWMYYNIYISAASCLHLERTPINANTPL